LGKISFAPTIKLPAPEPMRYGANRK